MDNKAVKDKITSLFHKYKYVCLVLLAGIFLMAMPKVELNSGHIQEEVAEIEKEQSTEEKLAEILTQVDGAGKVKVLLTYAKGEHTSYQMNTDSAESGDSENVSMDTVLITDANRQEKGLVVQVDPPICLGAIVLCQGADKPAVKLALTDAVSKVTGLGTNQITVLKMK